MLQSGVWRGEFFLPYGRGKPAHGTRKSLQGIREDRCRVGVSAAVQQEDDPVVSHGYIVHGIQRHCLL